MAGEVFNRYESKFLISAKNFLEVEPAIREHMEQDGNGKENNTYTISNIYYDTIDNYLIRHSLSKPEYKEKLRLRGYGRIGENDKVYMEIKKKYCGLVNKRRSTVRLNEAYEFARTGVKPELKQYMNAQVLNEIEYFLSVYKLEPKLFIAYDRKAYFGREDNELRITFDTNIRTRRDNLRLEAGDHGELLLDKGQTLMEIKAVNAFPLWLADLLSCQGIYKTSFSKYGKEHEKTVMQNARTIYNNFKGDSLTCSKPYSQQHQLIPQYQ